MFSRFSRQNRARYNGLGLRPRCWRAPSLKDAYLFLHSPWEDGRVERWSGSRTEGEENGKCPRPRPPLAYQHHRPERSSSTTIGLGGRERSSSQQLALLPARAVEPGGVVKVDLLRIGATSLPGNAHILLAIEKASKFPFAFPIPSKRAD